MERGSSFFILQVDSCSFLYQSDDNVHMTLFTGTEERAVLFGIQTIQVGGCLRQGTVYMYTL